jgi:uncharacterized damage-inducible protein DinB
MPTSDSIPTLASERADLLQALDTHRGFLRYAARELSDTDAARRPTVSALCLGGLIKHVTAVEAQWARFMVDGTTMTFDEASMQEHARTFQMLEGETLDGLLAAYEAVAARTDEVVASVPDLDVSYPRPEAPWNEPGARWTVRRAIVHIVAETAQHAGHADIIRETIDGSKTMG